MDMNEHFSPDSTSTMGPGGALPLPKERNLYFTSQVDQSSIAALSKSILEDNRKPLINKKSEAFS